MKASRAPIRWLTGTTAALAIAAAVLLLAAWAIEPEPAGEAVAPDPAQHREAVIQVYGADVIGVRGHFAIHTWVAVKGEDAPEYTIYEVIGWRLRRGRPALRVSTGDPARAWFGAPPVLLHELRGTAAAPLVARVREAVARYPYDREYRMWPGPNSNSFTAWIGLEVPELGLALPFKAIGQSWMRRNYSSVAGARSNSIVPLVSSLAQSSASRPARNP